MLRRVAPPPSRLVTESIGGGPDDFGLSSMMQFVAEKSTFNLGINHSPTGELLLLHKIERCGKPAGLTLRKLQSGSSWRL